MSHLSRACFGSLYLVKRVESTSIYDLTSRDRVDRDEVDLERFAASKEIKESGEDCAF